MVASAGQVTCCRLFHRRTAASTGRHWLKERKTKKSRQSTTTRSLPTVMIVEDLQVRSLVDEELNTKAKEEAETITTSKKRHRMGTSTLLMSTSKRSLIGTFGGHPDTRPNGAEDFSSYHLVMQSRNDRRLVKISPGSPIPYNLMG